MPDNSYLKPDDPDNLRYYEVLGKRIDAAFRTFRKYNLTDQEEVRSAISKVDVISRAYVNIKTASGALGDKRFPKESVNKITEMVDHANEVAISLRSTLETLFDKGMIPEDLEETYGHISRRLG